MTENWLPIPGYEKYYEVSDQGRVRSFDRVVRSGPHGGHRTIPGRVMKGLPDGLGYPYVRLAVAREGIRRGIHQLVLLAFVGPRLDGMVARHLNGDTADPRLANLEYGTYSQNGVDAVWHGTNANTRKVKCARGHEFSGDNLRSSPTKPGGVRRYCRACQRDNSRRYLQRKLRERCGAE